jgi:hypothetical protein
MGSSVRSVEVDRLRDAIVLTPPEQRRLERVKEFIAEFSERPLGRVIATWIKRSPPAPKGAPTGGSNPSPR